MWVFVIKICNFDNRMTLNERFFNIRMNDFIYINSTWLNMCWTCEQSCGRLARHSPFSAVPIQQSGPHLPFSEYTKVKHYQALLSRHWITGKTKQTLVLGFFRLAVKRTVREVWGCWVVVTARIMKRKAVRFNIKLAYFVWFWCGNSRKISREFI